MSDQTNSVNTERERFEIELDENLVFPSIADTAYMTSVELCKLTSELFKNIFADYEGCIFDAVNGTEPTISLLFNHGDYTGSDMPVACELLTGKNVGSVVIDRIRRMDSLKLEGDRYFLTDDAKDAISDLLTEKFYNNGKPNWKQITSEFQDRSNSYGGYYGYQQVPVYTKVSGISIKRLCRLLFGAKINGMEFEYDARIATAMNAGFGAAPQNTNYLMYISKISKDELSKVFEKVGLGPIQGANIIRG